MGIRIKIGGRIDSSSHTIPIRIGDVSCAIRCRDRKTSGHLDKLYGAFLSDKPADIRIELDIIERFDTPQVDSASPSTKVFKWGEQIAAICSLNADEPATASPGVRVTAERRQFNPRFGFKIMNLLLPAAYYTVQRKRHRENLPAMVVHACGILRGGRVMIFTGPSETGKTTVARSCGKKYGEVVNDEMLLVTGGGGNGGALMTQGVPIIGGVAQRLNVKAPPACVFMLKQSKKTSIRPLDRLEAYLRFMRQVIAPRDLVEPDDTRAMLAETTRFADLMTKAVPFYELEFTLEKEPLWRAVGEIEESLLKGEPAA